MERGTPFVREKVRRPRPFCESSTALTQAFKLRGVSQQRVILIATEKETDRREIEASVLRHLPNSKIYFAVDGSDAWGRLVNVPPQVLILHSALSKTDGFALVRSVLADPRFAQTAFIYMEPPPDREVFVEEIVTGRIQFLGWQVSEKRLATALARALNDVVARERMEFKTRLLIPGDQLMKKGDVATSVYLVRRGRLEARSEGAAGPVVLGVVEPGEFVGEMAYINGEPRSADVFALVESELIEIPINHLDVLLYQNPSWSQALMRTLSQRLRKANQTKINGGPDEAI